MGSCSNQATDGRQRCCRDGSPRVKWTEQLVDSRLCARHVKTEVRHYINPTRSGVMTELERIVAALDAEKPQANTGKTSNV